MFYSPGFFLIYRRTVDSEREKGDGVISFEASQE